MGYRSKSNYVTMPALIKQFLFPRAALTGILLSLSGFLFSGCGNPADGFYRLRGDAFRHGDDPREALNWYTRISSNSCNQEVLINMAECYDDIDDYTNLVGTYRALYRQSSDSTYLEMLLFVHKEYADNQGAIETLQTLVVAEPEELKFRGALISAMRQSSQSNRIPVLLEEYERSADGDDTELVFLSAMWDSVGNETNSLRLAREGLALAPSNTDWRLYLTETLTKQKLYQEALSNATRLAEEQRTNADILQLRGYIFNEMGDSSNAIRCFRQALRYDQQNILALNNLAYLLLSENRNISEGLELALSAVKLQRTAVTLDTLAYAYYRRGKHDVALRYLEEAEQLMQQEQIEVDPEIEYHFGLVYAELGQMHKALPRFRIALKRNPDLEKMLKLERYYQTLEPRLKH